MMRAIGIALIVALLALAVVLGWVAAEWHYDNCVSNANGRYPTVVDRRHGEPVDVNEPRRRRAIDGCSRSPV
ncbi:MAG TPA: hypothetical protein VKB17_07190 [Thermoleophilaceae bacterium]|nr:hypothetical protein [Thermoleophilaceae bacterium]